MQKTLINSPFADTLPLMPIKYPWAWEHFLNGCANNWLPHEVPMAEDAILWRSDELSGDERLLLMRNFGFFSTAESLVSNNLVLAIYKHITNAECRQYLLRQAFEESLHAHTFLYLCENLHLPSEQIFNMYREIPVIQEKEAFQIRLIEKIMDPSFSTESIEGAQTLLENLIGFYVIMEGIFFYGGFAMVLSFRRQNKMRGVCQLYELILRDETIHLNFGIDLINGIKEENPELWTKPFQEHVLKIIQEGVELEIRYMEECLPHAIFGLNSTLFRPYIQYIADRRLERIGLPRHYHTENPLPWMSEAIDLTCEKNFFEIPVTEYQVSAPLKWDNPS